MSKSRSELKKVKALAILSIAALLGGGIWGCGGGGSDGYDEPKATLTAPIAGQTQNVLIDAAILKGWADGGLLNNENSWEKVVLLDVTTAANYTTGHIPGAQLWDTAVHVMNRIEGPVEAVNMALDGPSMDALIQSHGIDEGTTIVLTSSSASGANLFQVGRAYFLFRYWGFPKDRIKVLNGFNTAWTVAGHSLTSVAPVIAESSFSVKGNPQLQADLRGSLSEVIAAVKNQTMQVVDFRADALPATVVAKTAGWTEGVFNDDHSTPADGTYDKDYLVFEGTIKGGKYYNYTRFLNPDGTATTADDHLLKGPAQLEAEFLAQGFGNSKKIISMCRTGMIASAGFLVLDGILGWDVMMYDGSWSQWGSLSTDTTKGGKLPAGLTAWATDSSELMDAIYYNKEVTPALLIEPARTKTPLAATPFDSGANNIEDEDRAYFEAPAGSAPGATSGGGGGGC